MKKSLFDKIKLQIALWKFGIKKSDLKEMYEITKRLEKLKVSDSNVNFKTKVIRNCAKL